MCHTIHLLQMKKISLFLTYLLVYVLFPPGAAGQIWKNFEKKIGKKIEQQADRRLEKKVDKAIDKGFDKIEESTEVRPKEKKQESAAAGSDNAPGAAVAVKNVPVTGTYRFKMGVTYRMESSDKKNKMPSTSIWISDESYIGMSSDAQKSMFMVMDDGRMIAFMEDKKTYMSLSSGFAGTIAGEAQKNAGDEKTEIVKIGTENIMGYACDVYKMTSSEGDGKIWLAPSIEVGGLMKSFAAIARNAKIPSNAPAGGLMLKMESKDRKKGETFTMTATEIHRSPRTIETSQYKSMGGL